MTPVIFDHCFGWLHEGEPTAACGVVLCQPFGREAMWVHKGWRVFAEALADSGAPTLRFDYAGTGDSAGESEDGEQIDEAVPTHGYGKARVVGLGGSAGGLAALQTFFGALPAQSGMVFVVILHLSPDH